MEGGRDGGTEDWGDGVKERRDRKGRRGSVCPSLPSPTPLAPLAPLPLTPPLSLTPYASPPAPLPGLCQHPGGALPCPVAAQSPGDEDWTGLAKQAAAEGLFFSVCPLAPTGRAKRTHTLTEHTRVTRYGSLLWTLGVRCVFLCGGVCFWSVLYGCVCRFVCTCLRTCVSVSLCFLWHLFHFANLLFKGPSTESYLKYISLSLLVTSQMVVYINWS